MGDGNGMGQYVSSVVRRVHLTGTHGHQAYDGKLLLGEITDTVVGALQMYGESAVEIVNTQNRNRGLGDSNCQVRLLRGILGERRVSDLLVPGLGEDHCAKPGGLSTVTRGDSRKGREMSSSRVITTFSLQLVRAGFFSFSLGCLRTSVGSTVRPVG